MMTNPIKALQSRATMPGKVTANKRSAARSKIPKPPGASASETPSHNVCDGENIFIVVRSADSKVERFPALANELAHLNVDIIVALNSLSGRAAQQATTTIPIVIPVMGDPVEDGLVVSLARPGGNVTGSTFLGPQLVPKRLALLKEAAPLGFPSGGSLASPRIRRAHYEKYG